MARTLGDYVEMGTYTLLSEARLVETLLESEGIEVHLRGAEFVGSMPHMANAVGGVGVYVPADQVERAQAVMASATGATPEPGEAEPGGGGAVVADRPATREAEESLAESPADASARRAWWSAVFGVVFLPVLMHTVSVVNLIACWSAAGPLSAKGRRRAILAGIIDALVLGAFTAWGVSRRL